MGDFVDQVLEADPGYHPKKPMFNGLAGHEYAASVNVGDPRGRDEAMELVRMFFWGAWAKHGVNTTKHPFKHLIISI